MAPSAISPAILASDGTLHSSNGSTRSGSGYRGYDHITWWVGNAKQAAAFYTMRMGFSLVAKRGLETGSRLFASHVVSNGAATFVLTSPLRPAGAANESASWADKQLLEEMHAHLKKHGDAVKDVAFEVDNVYGVYEQAVARGAESIQAPTVSMDKQGEVVTAVIKTYGDTTHTLVDRSGYHGVFFPTYRAVDPLADPIGKLLPPVQFEAVDHCVGNQDWNEMETVCN
ncbi:MAG: hypothetical protein LQ340_001299 [Diploschistes diacapsis]|nr:MAG: hypothetical protein LQ340_001299 [Diploschistes diacapsis]